MWSSSAGRPCSTGRTRRRLERCRADLARPELAHHSVRDLTARRGFPNASAFGRAFREAYGLTPREHRRRNMSGVSLPDH
ncbi:helix-turn-helix domain-containing protein [Kitasatospora purpeofusca]|uniref:helix-turn-helix domain-containing protein n=1 Tax=Kitasatospora purpeofusca TaxID=67352 RepID=UPI00225683C9|nr:helix-turn-helix domain-containing protein [Kitasatospora purpeofusca]MCX4683070.1 helix-turn-helix domain-containing protein [Kitasatospora purpeofusca]